MNSDDAYILVADNNPLLSSEEVTPSVHPHSFTPLISTFAGEAWRKTSEGIFTQVWPAGTLPGGAEFKIRMAAPPAIADEVLRRALPLIAAAGCPFKVISNTALLELVFAGSSFGKSSGDFIAIYPPTQEIFINLAEKLKSATQSIKSPPPAPPDDSGARPLLAPEHPWPGLDNYLPAESNYFFGRENEQAELAQRIEHSVVTVLLGRKCAGKTSLLQAGLKPAFERMRLEPVFLRLQFAGAADPVQQVRDEINRVLRERHINGEPFGEGQTLRDYFHLQLQDWLAADRKAVVPVLIFDQFEDVVEAAAVPGTGAPAAELWNQLADLVETQRARFKVLISLRQDHLPEFLAGHQQVHSIIQNHFLLEPFDGRKAFKAVLDPGRHLLDPASADAVAERIVRCVASERQDPDGGVAEPLEHLEVEPALLSFLCQQLNLARHRPRKASAGAGLITSELVDADAKRILEGFFHGSPTAQGEIPPDEPPPPRTAESVETELLKAPAFAVVFPELEPSPELEVESEPLPELDVEPMPLEETAEEQTVKRRKLPVFGLGLLFILLVAAGLLAYFEVLQRKQAEAELQESVSKLVVARDTLKWADDRLKHVESDLQLKESDLKVLAEQTRQEQQQAQRVMEHNSRLIAAETNFQSQLAELKSEKERAESRLAEWSRLVFELTNQVSNLTKQAETLKARNEALAISNKAIAILNQEKEALEANNESLAVSNETAYLSLFGDIPPTDVVLDKQEAAMESLPPHDARTVRAEIDPRSPRMVNILLTHGECFFAADGTNFQTLDVHYDLYQGAVLRTGKRSWVDLFIRRAGTTVRLAPESEIKISRLSESVQNGVPVADTWLILRNGRVFTVVRALVPGSTMEVSDSAGRSVMEGGGLGSYMITTPEPGAPGELAIVPLRVVSKRGNTLVAPGQKYSAKDGATLTLDASPWEKMLIQLDEMDAETDKALAGH